MKPPAGAGGFLIRPPLPGPPDTRTPRCWTGASASGARTGYSAFFVLFALVVVAFALVVVALVVVAFAVVALAVAGLAVVALAAGLAGFGVSAVVG